MYKVKSVIEFVLEKSKQDPRLEDIRHFKGTMSQFKSFWEEKMGKFNPYKNMEYKYPIKRKENDNSLPYQDFINGESSLVKNKKKRDG